VGGYRAHTLLDIADPTTIMADMGEAKLDLLF
jgi:hypothetical protein